MISTQFPELNINPLDVSFDDIVPEDFIHALSLTNRFVCRTLRPINVAQHSVYVARVVEALGGDMRAQRQAVLHDVSEAYLGDLNKWLKESPEFTFYRELEDRIQKKVYMKFDCDLEMHPLVEQADKLMVRFEAAHPSGYGRHIFKNPTYTPLTAQEVRLVGRWAVWTPLQSREIMRYTFIQAGGHL